MDYAHALNWAQRLLESNNIGTSRLDALVLLEDNSEIDRAKILASPETIVGPKVLKRFQSQIRRRATQEPLAYIRSKTEFFSREFYVDKRVLEPRPESEAIIEQLGRIMTKVAGTGPTVVDVGTGSGALAITAKLETPLALVLATDISPDAIDVARRNAVRHKADIIFSIGNLIEPLPAATWDSPNVIVIANLPYVPDSWHINAAARYEPEFAIFGGKDGLSPYRRLFKNLSSLPNPPAYVLTEAMPPQQLKLAQIASRHGFRLSQTIDFVQLFSLERSPT